MFGDPTFTVGQSFDSGTATKSGIFARSVGGSSLALLNTYASILQSYCDVRIATIPFKFFQKTDPFPRLGPRPILRIRRRRDRSPRRSPGSYQRSHCVYRFASLSLIAYSLFCPKSIHPKQKYVRNLQDLRDCFSSDFLLNSGIVELRCAMK